MECTVKDMTIHYQEVGSDRPILMLHGWPLDHRHMMQTMEPLFAHRPGWRRIYPDAPGMGKTRGPAWMTHHDEILDALLELLDTLAPGERFVVAGTSYGGYLARGCVHRRGSQIDGILLNVPKVETDDTKTCLPEHRVLREDAAFLKALSDEEQKTVREIQVVQSVEILQDYRTVIAPAVAIADQEFLHRIQPNHFVTFDVDALAEPFPAPALFLTGRYDHWCGYREAYRLLDDYPRATFAVLDCAGHNLPFEQKSLFRALANEWLDRVEEYARQGES